MEARRCSACGHEWALRGDVEPKRCPNHACRSQNWKMAKPKLAGILKQEPLTEADRQWGRDEIERISALKAAGSTPRSEKIKREPVYDYGEGQN